MENTNMSPQFHYIDDEQLRKLFGICMDSGCQYLTVYFCIYSIDTNCFIEGSETNPKTNANPTRKIEHYNMIYPFVEFLVEPTVNAVRFPRMYYQCPNFSENILNEEIDKTTEQIHFETECIKYLFSLYDDKEGSLHLNQIDLSQIYKGFIDGTNSSHVYVFFDITSMKSKLKPIYKKATINELYNKKTVNGLPVNERIVNLLHNNTELRYMRDQHGHRLQRPVQLYLCKKTDHGYVSLRYDENPIYQPYVHDIFGPAYYFSATPLTGDANSPNLNDYRRYACYETGLFALEKDVAVDFLTDDEKNEIRENVINAATFVFLENGVQLWGIKNILHFTEII